MQPHSFTGETLPRLRLLDAHMIVYEGMQYLHLRDPLAISGKTLLVPQPLIPILGMLDGAHDPGALRSALAIRYGLRLTPEQIQQFIQSLDDALYLENANFLRGRLAAQDEFRNSDCRLPASAGQAYPEDRGELTHTLQGYMDVIQPDDADPPPQPGRIRGIISPHIDYERGGGVYARVWSQVAGMDMPVERVILLGTDHFSEGFSFSLTGLDYSTPLGRLSTDPSMLSAAAAAIGGEAAFTGELHHKAEHSIELAAVWLQHILGDRHVSILPVLCGSLTSFEDTAGDLSANPVLNNLVSLFARFDRRKTYLDRRRG